MRFVERIWACLSQIFNRLSISTYVFLFAILYVTFAPSQTAPLIAPSGPLGAPAEPGPPLGSALGAAANLPVSRPFCGPGGLPRMGPAPWVVGMTLSRSSRSRSVEPLAH